MSKLPPPSVSPCQCYFEKGIKEWGTPKAKDFFIECLKVDSEHKDARYNLGLILYQEQVWDKCCEHMSVFEEKYNDSCYYEGKCLLNMGKKEEAVAIFKRCKKGKCALELVKLNIFFQSEYENLLESVKPDDEDSYREAQYLLGQYYRRQSTTKVWHEYTLRSANLGYKPAIDRIFEKNDIIGLDFCKKIIKLDGEYVVQAWKKYFELEKQPSDLSNKEELQNELGVDWKYTEHQIRIGKIDKLLIKKVMYFYNSNGLNWRILRKWGVSKDRTIDDYPLLKTIVDYDNSSIGFMAEVAFKAVKLRITDQLSSEDKYDLHKMISKYMDIGTSWTGKDIIGECQYLLSEWYETGFGCLYDLEKSREYLTKSITNGYQPAILKNSELSSQTPFSKIATGLMDRAEQGDKHACFLVGLVYNLMGDEKNSRIWLENSKGGF